MLRRALQRVQRQLDARAISSTSSPAGQHLGHWPSPGAEAGPAALVLTGARACCSRAGQQTWWHHSPQLVIGKDLFAHQSSQLLRDKMPDKVDIDPIVKLGKDFPNEEVRLEQPGEAAPEAMECIKRTYQPSVRVRKRRHGFLSRLRTKGGMNVLLRRLQKGRWKQTA